MSHITFVLALFFWYKYGSMIKILLVNFYNLITKSLPPQKIIKAFISFFKSLS